MLEGKLGRFEDAKFQAIGEQLNDRGIFVGCALEQFSRTAKDLFLIAYDTGLKRDHRVLEVGAGCLRTGCWFIEFLATDRYFGIEPNQPMLDAGIGSLLPEALHQKSPQFSQETDFRFDVFPVSFDWIVGYSIWSHCSRDQIEKMVVQAAAMNSRMLFSFAPAHPRRPAYTGSGWIGKSHVSDTRGIAYHDIDWLIACFTTHSLRAYLLPAVSGAQLWLYAEPK